jgi:hypothetical protein
MVLLPHKPPVQLSLNIILPSVIMLLTAAVLLNKITMLSLCALCAAELFCESKSQQKMGFNVDIQILK